MKKATHHRISAVTMALCIGVFSNGHAEELPLFEIGFGPGAISQNYYAGTKDTRDIVFPAIIPVYRGNTLKSDERGARAELFDNRKYKLEMSLDFNLAIDSEDITVREGMPDLNSLLQIGPSLQISLDRTANREWVVRLPLRAGTSIGSSFDTVGFTFSPDLTYLRDLRFNGSNWRLGLSLGPQFGTSEYHDFYYGVNPEFATATRPAYQANAGLTNYRFLATFTSSNRKRITTWFLRYEDLSGSVIEDSPLVETNSGLTVGFLYSWLVFKSKAHAPSP